MHLGSLVKYMRMLGLDTLYRNDYTNDELVKISHDEKRTILTKDRSILKRNDVTHGYWVRSAEPEEQVKEIIDRFNLKDNIKEFSRCLQCNSGLVKKEKTEIEARLPPKVKERINEFNYCPACDKIYWKGSHYEKMKKILDKLFD